MIWCASVWFREGLVWWHNNVWCNTMNWKSVEWYAIDCNSVDCNAIYCFLSNQRFFEWSCEKVLVYLGPFLCLVRSSLDLKWTLSSQAKFWFRAMSLGTWSWCPVCTCCFTAFLILFLDGRVLDSTGLQPSVSSPASSWTCCIQNWRAGG